ncbi:MAG: PDZ domain-containing protein, partial [Pontibacterium sp.]
GVNSQIYTRSGGFMGLSFAIPIDVAIEVADQLKEKGFVTRGWLGVVIQEVNKDLAESFGLDKPAGALVAKVLPNSPAQDIGLESGDVILKFNNKPVVVSADLPHLVGRVKPGTQARLTVARGGETITLKGKIGELPSNNKPQTQRTHQKQEQGNPLNLVVSELDDNRRQKWNISEGVVVRRVLQGAGADAGLVVGDVITMLNGHRVTDVVSFDNIAASLPVGKSVPMRIVRRGEPLFIALKLHP